MLCAVEKVSWCSSCVKRIVRNSVLGNDGYCGRWCQAGSVKQAILVIRSDANKTIHCLFGSIYQSSALLLVLCAVQCLLVFMPTYDSIGTIFYGRLLTSCCMYNVPVLHNVYAVCRITFIPMLWHSPVRY